MYTALPHPPYHNSSPPLGVAPFHEVNTSACMEAKNSVNILFVLRFSTLVLYKINSALVLLCLYINTAQCKGEYFKINETYITYINIYIIKYAIQYANIMLTALLIMYIQFSFTFYIQYGLKGQPNFLKCDVQKIKIKSFTFEWWLLVWVVLIIDVQVIPVTTLFKAILIIY